MGATAPGLRIRLKDGRTVKLTPEHSTDDCWVVIEIVEAPDEFE